MSRRRTEALIKAAADQANDAAQAARILQARGQEVKAERAASEEAAPKPPSEEVVQAMEKIPRGNRVQEAIREEIRRSRGEPQEETKTEVEDETPKPVKSVEQKAQQEQETKADETAQAATEPVKPAADVGVGAEAAAPEAPKLETVRVKVDGEEFDVPKEEVEAHGGIKTYQIYRAQENRFNKMKQEMQVLRQLQAQAQSQAKPPAPVQSDEEFIASKMDAIRFGTQQEAAAALREVLARKEVNQNQIVWQASLAFQKQQGVNVFKTEFPEIVSNPILMRLAQAIEQDVMMSLAQNAQPNQPIDFAAIYRGIGNQIRAAIPRQHQAQAPAKTEATPTSAATSDKEARKASITEPPKAAARAALPETDEKPETREQALNRMRRSRGLPAL